MFRLTLRLVSMGLLAAPGLLLAMTPALSVAPPPTGGKSATGPCDDAKAPSSTTVTIDKAGVATFVQTYKGGGTIALCFRSADYDDAARTLIVSSDPKVSPATGSLPPVVAVLREKKDAAPLLKPGPAFQLTDLLGSLRGQTVEVSPDGTAAATLLSIDSLGGQAAAKDATGTPAPTAAKTLTLWTKEKGVFMIALSATTTIKFSDPATTKQVQQALDDLASGDAQAPRALVVKLPAVKSSVTYRHPLAGFDTSYALTLGPKTAAISARVTVRNSTPQAWTNAEIRLDGLPWPGPPAVQIVTLKPDDSATFTVLPTLDPVIKLVGDTLTYTSQQVSPNPDRKFTLTARAKSVFAIPGPVALVEDGQSLGQLDGLDFGGGVKPVVKVSPYSRMSIRQLEQDAAPPTEVKLADGFLEYCETRQTTLIVTNSAEKKTLTLKATNGWSLGPKDAPVASVPIPAKSSSTFTLEEFAPRRVSLASGPGVAAFVASLSEKGATAGLVKEVKRQQAETAAALSALDQKRQALAAAVQAIAARQPAIAGTVPAALLPQLAQDEAVVAGLRQQIDAIPAAKAALQRDLEASIRQQVEEYVGGLAKPSADDPPPVPPEERRIEPR
jgi:hypothetical protein